MPKIKRFSIFRRCRTKIDLTDKNILNFLIYFYRFVQNIIKFIDSTMGVAKISNLYQIQTFQSIALCAMLQMPLSIFQITASIPT